MVIFPKMPYTISNNMDMKIVDQVARAATLDKPPNIFFVKQNITIIQK